MISSSIIINSVFSDEFLYLIIIIALSLLIANGFRMYKKFKSEFKGLKKKNPFKYYTYKAKLVAKKEYLNKNGEIFYYLIFDCKTKKLELLVPERIYFLHNEDEEGTLKVYANCFVSFD